MIFSLEAGRPKPSSLSAPTPGWGKGFDNRGLPPSPFGERAGFFAPGAQAGARLQQRDEQLFKAQAGKGWELGAF